LSVTPIYRPRRSWLYRWRVRRATRIFQKHLLEEMPDVPIRPVNVADMEHSPRVLNAWPQGVGTHHYDGQGLA
jgi:hypothetical protein